MLNRLDAGDFCRNRLRVKGAGGAATGAAFNSVVKLFSSFTILAIISCLSPELVNPKSQQRSLRTLHDDFVSSLHGAAFNSVTVVPLLVADAVAAT